MNKHLLRRKNTIQRRDPHKVLPTTRRNNTTNKPHKPTRLTHNQNKLAISKQCQHGTKTKPNQIEKRLID
jgi:hypothetical protein